MKAAAARARRRVHPAFKLAFVLLGVCVALALAEVTCRLFWTLPPWFAEFGQAGMYVATDDGDVALVPGYRGTLQVDTLTHVAIDSLGMRGPEPGEKRDGERRLLVLGDSLVWGYGVEAEQAFPARLQQRLRDAGSATTVGNAGVPGFGVRHAVGHMSRLDRPFGADAFVLCGYLGNDAADEVFSRRVVYAGLQLQGDMARLVQTSWRTRLALRSRAALWLETWIFTAKPEWSPLTSLPPDPEEQQRAAGMPGDAQRHAGLFLDVRDEKTSWQQGAPPVIPRLLDLLRDALRRAKQHADHRPLVFVVLPTLWQVDESKRVEHLKQLGLDPSQFERGLAQQRWLQLAKELAIPALDATPMLAAEHDPAGLFLSDGGHFSVRGNDVVAAWLAQELPPLLQ